MLNRFCAGLCLLMLSWPAAASLHNRRGRGPQPEYAAGRVLVKFKSLPASLPARIQSSRFDILPPEVQDLLSRRGISGFKRVFGGIQGHSAVGFSSILSRQVPVPDLYGWTALEVSSGADVPALVAALRRESLIEYAGPDYLRSALQATPNDPYFSQQWQHKNTGQNGGTAGHDMSSTLAWQYVTGSTTVVIAVVDTGISLAHPDLAANLISGQTFVAGTPSANDDNGHGTHVAGIAGAVGNNAADIAGTMWRASLMPVKVLDNTGAGADSDIAAGIQWAADHRAQVINMSLGGPTDDPVLKSAVDYAYNKGAVLIAAAGNDGGLAPGCPPVCPPTYPGAYSNVVSVAATNGKDIVASYSTVGSWVSLSAPGSDILSTWPSSIANFPACDLGTQAPPNAQTSYDCGTSMATPMVSGAAGLILSRFPGISQMEVASHLVSGVDSIRGQNPSLAGLYGTGRLNLRKATAVKPAVVSSTVTLAPAPNVFQNNTVVDFAMTISSELAQPQAALSLVDQSGRPLTAGTTVSCTCSPSLSGVSFTGSIQAGNLSLNYPTASIIKLRVGLFDGVYTSTTDVQAWTLQESGALPGGGGSASVWNGIFNPLKGGKATVRLTLSSPGHVTIRIYNRNGTLVRTLADEDATSAGVKTWDWTGANDGGLHVASGIYLIHISAPGIQQTQKAIVVK